MNLKPLNCTCISYVADLYMYKLHREFFRMDVRKIFRKLVTNQFSCLEDFGYFGQRFAFRTVFSKTAYSYCCCSCSFEHEYLGYLSDSGHINEQLYEKIVKSIVEGQCPHVVKVSGYSALPEMFPYQKQIPTP